MLLEQGLAYKNKMTKNLPSWLWERTKQANGVGIAFHNKLTEIYPWNTSQPVHPKKETKIKYNLHCLAHSFTSSKR